MQFLKGTLGSITSALSNEGVQVIIPREEREKTNDAITLIFKLLIENKCYVDAKNCQKTLSPAIDKMYDEKNVVINLLFKTLLESRKYKKAMVFVGTEFDGKDKLDGLIGLYLSMLRSLGEDEKLDEKKKQIRIERLEFLYPKILNELKNQVDVGLSIQFIFLMHVQLFVKTKQLEKLKELARSPESESDKKLKAIVLDEIGTTYISQNCFEEAGKYVENSDKLPFLLAKALIEADRLDEAERFVGSTLYFNKKSDLYQEKEADEVVLKFIWVYLKQGKTDLAIKKITEFSEDFSNFYHVGSRIIEEQFLQKKPYEEIVPIIKWTCKEDCWNSRESKSKWFNRIAKNLSERPEDLEKFLIGISIGDELYDFDSAPTLLKICQDLFHQKIKKLVDEEKIKEALIFIDSIESLRLRNEATLTFVEVYSVNIKKGEVYLLKDRILKISDASLKERALAKLADNCWIRGMEFQAKKIILENSEKSTETDDIKFKIAVSLIEKKEFKEAMQFLEKMKNPKSYRSNFKEKLKLAKEKSPNSNDLEALVKLCDDLDKECNIL